MKWIWRRLASGARIDRWFGVVYYDYVRFETVTTWIGLNLIVRWSLLLYWWVRNPCFRSQCDRASLMRQFRDAHYWRERWSDEAIAAGMQVAKLWEENKALKHEIEKLRTELIAHTQRLTNGSEP